MGQREVEGAYHSAIQAVEILLERWRWTFESQSSLIASQTAAEIGERNSDEKVSWTGR